jgi:hypothetical protein
MQLDHISKLKIFFDSSSPMATANFVLSHLFALRWIAVIVIA